MLNGRMRRRDVLEYALYQSLHAERATREQVRHFLQAAPPEVWILLAGLTQRTAEGPTDREEMADDPIVRGFVGSVLHQRSDR